MNTTGHQLSSILDILHGVGTDLIYSLLESIANFKFQLKA